MAAAAIAVPTALDIGALRGVQVLLVKDNEINRMLAARAMQAWGIEVTEAVGGAEAAQLFNEQAFGVVLMDIQMPGMSGFEAPVLLLQHPANAFHTGHARYLAVGLNDCLAKPFEEAELYAKLQKLLRRP